MDITTSVEWFNYPKPIDGNPIATLSSNFNRLEIIDWLVENNIPFNTLEHIICVDDSDQKCAVQYTIQFVNDSDYTFFKLKWT